MHDSSNASHAKPQKKVDAQEVERRRRFLLLTDEDEQNLAAMREAVSSASDTVVERFYAHLTGTEETRLKFQSEKHLARVKQAQARYFGELFEGKIDVGYFENRLKVGRAHERIGLGPQWYIGAYSLYLCELLPVIMQHHAGNPEEGQRVYQSLIKRVCFDMAVAIDTYIEAIGEREADQVSEFVRALTGFSSSLGTESEGIQGATVGQSSAAQQQAAAIAEVTTTLSELRQMSAQALEKAEAVIGESDRSVDAAQMGAQSVEASIQGMRDIREQVEAIAQKIVSLSEQTQQIGEIISSVNEIAEQSKLLALNAAIEAARAGEHGKGFAVVAAEIRSLADQSKQATGRVKKILGDIQAATNSAVIATEEGTRKVEAGTGLANRAGESIHQLGRSIEEASGAARLIANASRQQSSGIQQVSEAMGSINQAVVSTVAILKQTESSAQKLAEMTANMNSLVESFSKPKEKSLEFRLNER